MTLPLVCVVILSARGEAVCGRLSSCLCFGPTRVGVTVTEAVDGARATVRVESTTAGLDAGAVLEFPREQAEVVGARWLVLDLERRRIDRNGAVSCRPGDVASPSVPATAVATAVLSEQCDEELESLGLITATCNDVGRACSSTPVVLFPAVVAAWALRRRRVASRGPLHPGK